MHVRRLPVAWLLHGDATNNVAKSTTNNLATDSVANGDGLVDMHRFVVGEARVGLPGQP